jgi:hypothetical protein
MQYDSDIYIRVISPDVWRRFEDADDAGFDLADLAKEGRVNYTINGAYLEEELKGIVSALSKTLGKDGIIMSQTMNININPPTPYCVCYFGSDAFDFYSDYSPETSISDEVEWLNNADIGITGKIEKDQLLRFGIITSYKRNKVIYSEYLGDLDLPDKIYLRETGFNDRVKNIEKTDLSEDVKLSHVKNNPYDSMLIEVKGKEGSLGFLPSDVGNQIAPLLDNGMLEYTANICEVVKASQRNKYAKSPIVAINIVGRQKGGK